MAKKRKIIEIYVTENEEDNTVTFDFERCEDTEIANATMKRLLMMIDVNRENFGIENDIEADFEGE